MASCLFCIIDFSLIWVTCCFSAFVQNNVGLSWQRAFLRNLSMPLLYRYPRDFPALLSRFTKIAFVLANLPNFFRLSLMMHYIIHSGRFDGQIPLRFHAKNRTKYLRPYLSLDFSFKQRFAACISFYKIFSACFLRQRSEARFHVKDTLWEGRNANLFALTIEQAVDCLMEGELTLAFTMDNMTLYRVTISVFEGACIGVACPRVVFVGGIQGAPNSKELQRAAARLNGEIAPLDMLVIAVRALAEVFDAAQIVGVRNSDQISHAYADDKIFFDYDLFWESLGASRDRAGYLLEIEPPEKSLLDLTASHRSRAKRKRKLKKSIQLAIREKAIELFSPSGASHATNRTKTATNNNFVDLSIDQDTSGELSSPSLV